MLGSNRFRPDLSGYQSLGPAVSRDLKLKFRALMMRSHDETDALTGDIDDLSFLTLHSKLQVTVVVGHSAGTASFVHSEELFNYTHEILPNIELENIIVATS